MMNCRWILCIIMLVLSPAVALSDEFRVVPSLAVRENYNSNVLFSSNNVRRDFITTLSPGVEMVNRDGRTDTDLLVRLDRLEYADNRALSATNETIDGKVRYLVTPLLGISTGAGYVRNSNPTLAVGPTGIVTTASPWDHITSSISADYQLSELAGLGLSYNYAHDHYKNRSDLDGISQDINAGFVYDLGKYFPLMKGRGNIGFNRYSFQDSGIDTIIGTVGLSRDLSETLSISADGGMRRTSSDIAVPQQVPVFIPGLPFPVGTEVVTTHLKSDGWGWVVSAALSYKGEVSNCDLSYVRDLTPAYGSSGAAERNALTLSARYQPTYELSLTLSSGYYTLKSGATQFSVRKIDQTTIQVSPGVRYEFSKDMFFEAAYEYASVDDSVLHTNARRDIIYGRFYIQRPFFE